MRPVEGACAYLLIIILACEGSRNASELMISLFGREGEDDFYIRR